MTNEEMMRRMVAPPRSQIKTVSREGLGLVDITADEPSSLYSKDINRHFAEQFPDSTGFAYTDGGADIKIDVMSLAPSEEKPYYLLYTCGMSDKPMNTPQNAKDMERAELYMLLPDSWPFPPRGEIPPYSSFWPIRLLRALGRFPHTEKTWLGRGHTVSNGLECVPFMEGSELCAVILSEPSRSFSPLIAEDGEKIRFYIVIPIYREELEIKDKYGVTELYKLFSEEQLALIVDMNRENLAMKYSPAQA